MESLKIMNSKSQTQTLCVSLPFTWVIEVQLILYNEMLNQLGFSGNQYYSMDGPRLSSYTLLAWFMRVGSAFSSLMCIKVFW